MVQSSVRTTEPLVTLRQSLLRLAQQELPNTDLSLHIQKCWLQRASISRQANQLVNAYGMLVLSRVSSSAVYHKISS